MNKTATPGRRSPNFANRTLFHADNLDIMRGIDSNCIDLIATDPPFNKGRDFHSTPDKLREDQGGSFQDRWNWKNDVHQDWMDKIENDYEHIFAFIAGIRESSRQDMAAYLCFMAVRLLEMHRILKDTGSLFLHCDPAASHYLKRLLDLIFGDRNFRNEIIWFYKTGGTSKRWFARKHDVIFFFSKTEDYKFFPQQEKSYLSHKYGFANIEIFKDKDGIYRKVGMRDVWDIPALRGNQAERTGYPTQKPLALYERIVKAATDKDRPWVLDPFCGCATTCVAAERLGRHWAGIDIWDKAYNTMIKRVAMDAGVEFPKGVEPDSGTRKTLHGLGKPIRLSIMPQPRRDDGKEAVPYINVPERTTSRDDRPEHTRARMKAILVEQHGIVCQGCMRQFDHEAYLELDHIQPRSDGGSNALENRTLLCWPCKGTKGNIFTLKGLIRENKKSGFWRGA